MSELIERTLEKSQNINIVLYGPGKIGCEFLGRVSEHYDEVGLTVVGVADRSGMLAKLGGFSIPELIDIIEVKKSGAKIEDIPFQNGEVYIPNNNIFLLEAAHGRKKMSYTIGPGAGVKQTADAIIHDLLKISPITTLTSAF